MATPRPDHREIGELLCAYGERLGLEGDDEGAQKAFACAMSIAKHEGDLTLEMLTLANAAMVDTFHIRPEQSLAKSLRAIELAERVDDPLPGMTAYMHASRVNYMNADLPSARPYAATYLALSEKAGVPAYLARSLYLNQKVAWLGGEWTAARQFCDRGLLEEPQHGFLLSVRLMVEYAVGDFKQGEAFLERKIEALLASPPEPSWLHVSVPQAVAAIAHMTGTIRYFDIAQAAAQTVLASQRVNPLWRWYSRTGLALMAAQQGDTRTVQEHYRALGGQRGNLMTMDDDRVLGILATAIGELDRAAAHFETALTVWNKGRYPEYAWIAYDYADMLLARGNVGDQERARELLEKALSIASELGMAPLMEHVLLRKESVNTC